VIAADAVVMQIQSWEGAAWSCAEAVWEGATPLTVAVPKQAVAEKDREERG
jgi:hypothetical protein